MEADTECDIHAAFDQLRRDMNAGFERQTERIISILRRDCNRLIAAFTLITGLVIALARFS